MSFIHSAAEGALALTLDRVKAGTDHGQFNVRPEMDIKQQADLLAQQADGRQAEIYRQCLEYHGFRWHDLETLPMLEGGVARTSGEWRHPRMQLAFTPQDLVSGFPLGPESLDSYLRDRRVELKIQAGRVKKADVRKKPRHRL